MRQYEEERDPVPPGCGERVSDYPEEVPVCPVCRHLMRRREGTLVCDVHGVIGPVYEKRSQEE